MNQKDLLDPSPVEPQEPVLPSADKQDSKTIEFARARIFLFILLPILILFFNADPIIFSIITSILILLGVSMFDPISDTLLKYCEGILITFEKLLRGFWRFLSSLITPSIGPWFRSRRRLITECASAIAIAILLAMTTLHPFVATTSGNINDFLCLKTPLPWFACGSGYSISALPDGVRIGVIDGVHKGSNNDTLSGPFDPSILNQDEIKVENLIFAENQQACTGQHITLVAATMLSRTVEDPLSGATLGLQNLEGYYLAQHQYNHIYNNQSQAPPTRLCLAIANLGTPDTANSNSTLVQRCPGCYSMPQIIYQIAQLAHSDPNVRGIVGFPYSQQVTEALPALANYPGLANLSVISPSASSDSLSSENNFYRIDAPDRSQGEAMASFFCSHLLHGPASIAIFTDSADAYSGDLPQDFQASIGQNKACSAQVNMSPLINYTNGDSQSISKAVDTALKVDHANYIFFPGYDEDLDSLQLEIHNDLQNQPNGVTIIGGDGLNNVDATTHYAYSVVYAASFAQPLPLNGIIQDFERNGFTKPTFVQNPTGELWIPKDTLLAVDAVQAFTQTIQKLHWTNFTQKDFNAALKFIDFSGLSGEILFQGNRINSGHASDRDQENVYITCYDHSHTLYMLDTYNTIIDAGSVKEENGTKNTSLCT